MCGFDRTNSGIGCGGRFARRSSSSKGLTCWPAWYIRATWLLPCACRASTSPRVSAYTAKGNLRKCICSFNFFLLFLRLFLRFRCKFFLSLLFRIISNSRRRFDLFRLTVRLAIEDVALLDRIELHDSLRLTRRTFEYAKERTEHVHEAIASSWGLITTEVRKSCGLWRSLGNSLRFAIFSGRSLCLIVILIITE